MTQTFVAKSGNVALMEIKGKRGNAEVVDVEWHRKPSKKDMREVDEWWQNNRTGCIGTASALIEDPSERKATIDQLLYGGQRN